MNTPLTSTQISTDGHRPAVDLWDLSRQHWMTGQWSRLAEVSVEQVENTEMRGHIALLISGAHQHLGNPNNVQKWGELAIFWGASRSALLKIQIAGVHHTLAACHAMTGDMHHCHSHITEAVEFTKDTPFQIAHHARAFHMLRELGLLKEAGEEVDRFLSQLKTHNTSTSNLSAQIQILKTEISLIQSELLIAQKRGQIQGIQKTSSDSNHTQEEAERIWLEDLSKRATSQIGQELWVLKMTSYKRGGFFVEFGATNGILLSNSYILEREFGWRGICAEPNPHSFKVLQENRACILSPSCIGATTGEEVEFIFADVYGGMARDADCDTHKDKRDAYRDAGEVAILTTISLNDFLEFHQAPKTIDYISIDTEGSEYSILENFPFQNWDVQMWTIEHNFTEQREKIRVLMEANGYHRQQAQWDDWYYKKEMTPQ